MEPAQLLQERQQKDAFFASSTDSPLTPAQRELFGGLRYYPPNPALVFTVSVPPLADGKFISIQTTRGDFRMYKRYGRFQIEVEGQPVELTLYETDFGFFLPFVDAGAGEDTYPAGRYLEPEYLGDNRFVVDFNRAYSPYCAYGSGWSCPITPAENRLSLHIRAGEMTPQGDWVTLEE